MCSSLNCLLNAHVCKLSKRQSRFITVNFNFQKNNKLLVNQQVMCVLWQVVSVVEPNSDVSFGSMSFYL